MNKASWVSPVYLYAALCLPMPVFWYHRCHKYDTFVMALKANGIQAFQWHL